MWVSIEPCEQEYLLTGSQLLVQKCGIAEDHIFSSRDLSFAKGIRRITGGYGVDVVLNSLAGDVSSNVPATTPLPFPLS